MFVRVLRDFCRRTTAVPVGENVVNRLIHVAAPLEKNRDRRSFLASVPRKDEGTEGEKFVFIDSAITKWVFFYRFICSSLNETYIFSYFIMSGRHFCWSLFRCVRTTDEHFVIVWWTCTNLKVLFFWGKKKCSLT